MRVLLGPTRRPREIRFTARFVLAALQDLEDEAIALFAVLAKQRLDVLERRRLERFKPVALVDVAHDAHDVLALADVVRQEIACPAWRLRGSGHW